MIQGSQVAGSLSSAAFHRVAFLPYVQGGCVVVPSVTVICLLVEKEAGAVRLLPTKSVPLLTTQRQLKAPPTVTIIVTAHGLELFNTR